MSRPRSFAFRVGTARDYAVPCASGTLCRIFDTYNGACQHADAPKRKQKEMNKRGPHSYS